jgi:hypothetical protein
VSRPSHPHWFHHPNNIWWWINYAAPQYAYFSKYLQVVLYFYCILYFLCFVFFSALAYEPCLSNRMNWIDSCGTASGKWRDVGCGTSLTPVSKLYETVPPSGW